MQNKEDLKVGDTIFKAISTRRGEEYNLEPLVINKVGKKYYYAGYRDWKIDKATLRHTNDNYSGNNFNCYLSEEDFFKAIETREVERQVKAFFSGYGKLNISDEDLKVIYETISKYTKP
jgi:hypothetical protein